jgi:prefoldin alpha subunit|tara:strand:+ start:508 stop:1026 length:519 start_codon:yes stop_codon:yes gene_type:complete
MGNTDRAELQRIADLVETNRERLQNIESQVVRLEEVRQEQARAIMALKAIPASGANDAMIPLGGGVQIIADIPSEGGAVIDIGSGIQAEKTREEALELLSSRNEELIRLMDSLRSEFDETEKLVIELANQFNEGIEELQGEESDTEDSTNQETENRPRRRRRKRGTEFTLDD